MTLPTPEIPLILKANGERQVFDPHKLEQSLLNSKATPEIAAQVIDHIRSEITDGMSTSQIYKHAFFILHKLQKPAAQIYSLRKGIANLGPSGFPFEKYVAEIFRSLGYTAETNIMATGACVSHEVDVVAWNDHKLIMTEAKFHNQLGLKSDVKVALYIKARADDLAEVTHYYGGKRRKLDEFWLVTNTKFTTTAIEYGMCKGLKMIGWNYPVKGNLQDMIEDGDLIPLACLNELNTMELKLLLLKGLVLCKQVRGNKQALVDAGLSEKKAQKVVTEIGAM